MSKPLVAIVVSSLVFGACAKKGPESETAASLPPPPAQTIVVAEPAPPPVEPAPLPAPPPVEQPAPVPATLTDAQIVHVLATVDSAEIEQAKLAQKKSKNPQVKKFAAHMIQHHTKSKTKGAAWAKKAKLTPEESPVSTELTSKGAAQLEALNTAEPALFDTTYIGGQATQHQEVLTLLNAQLEPNSQSPDLKAMLGEVKTMVEGHITEATTIQQALNAAAPAPATP
jgi:putative membrane protein